MKAKHTFLERCAALVLSILLIAALLPNSTIALAADYSEILSFEQENPVASIFYKTGDSVNLSDFPIELTAVISETPQSFTQVKPDDADPYTAPEDADTLYEAGITVIYSYAGSKGAEYRVYGEVDGGTGWYACDAGGTIYGKIQSVPVTWDISAVSTASAGTYAATGSVRGYTLSCPAPEAAVTVTAKSGDENIGLHAITWISGTPDGNDLSLTPATNAKTRAAYQIDFSKGGDEEIPAGQIEIRIPAHIFYGRDGNPADTITVPLAKAPDETGDTGFNYTVDENTGEIVIRNYRTVEASYHFTCQIGYDFYPYQVADGYEKGDVQADFCVKDSKGDLTVESEKLNVSVHTETRTPLASKSASQKYETWQDAWGEKPEDAADYFYVEWQLYTKINRGTQPFTLTLQEDLGEYGEIIGWRTSSYSSTYALGDADAFSQTIFVTDGPTSTGNGTFYSTCYVVVRYPRSMLETTSIIKNSYTASINGYDGDTKASTASASYTYVAPDLTYKGDYCRVNKGGGMDVNGGVNLLNAGKSSEDYFSLDVMSRGFEMTNGGKDPYTTVLEDDLLFMDETQLSAGDYMLTGFYISNLSEYDYRIDPEKGYQSTINTNYESYSPIAVWIKTVNAPDVWEKYGTVTRQSSGEYLWEDMNGNSSTVSRSARVNLPEGTAKIRFTHTGVRYQVAFSARLYYELLPTEHVLQLLGNKDSFYIMNFDSAFGMDKDGVIRTSPSGGGTFNSTYARIIGESDQNQYGQKVSHAYARNTYTGLTPYSNYTKTSSSPKSDTANSQETVEYTLVYNEYVNYSNLFFTQQDILDLGIIHEQRESVFYDLLPIGTTIDPSSIHAATYTARSNHFDMVCDYTLETVENWCNTGRTMLKIHVTAPANVINTDRYYTNGILRSGFAVKFTLINTWQNIGDYGATVHNSSAYYSLDGPLVGGFADTGGNIAEKEYFKDLDGDGNPPDAWKNVKYADTTTTFDPLIAAEVGFKKSVRASDELNFSSDSQVTAAGTYTYQLRFANSRNVNTNNVVMFDVLESAHGSNPYWQGTLQSINTSQPQSKGIAPIIYYSTYQGFTNLTVDGHQTDLNDTSIWSTTAPKNLADVTAIAIDLRYKADGTEYVFAPEEVALCYITMAAPENYWDYIDDPQTDENEAVYAYNSAYLQCTTTPVYGGTGSTSVEECSPVTVSLRAPDVEIHKTSDPESGTQTAPTMVEIGSTITYHLTVTNKGKAEAIYSLKLEDIIPDGLSIRGAEIQYCFGNKISNLASIEGALRTAVYIDGQRLVFTADQLNAGETLHLLIPVTVEESGVVFENTAKLTEFNGKTWDFESETTWHQTGGGYELPNTGGPSLRMFYVAGSILVIASLWLRRRKRKKLS